VRVGDAPHSLFILLAVLLPSQIADTSVKVRVAKARHHSPQPSANIHLGPHSPHVDSGLHSRGGWILRTGPQRCSSLSAESLSYQIS
jgi:hypothetical protein